MDFRQCNLFLFWLSMLGKGRDEDELMGNLITIRYFFGLRFTRTLILGFDIVGHFFLSVILALLNTLLFWLCCVFSVFVCFSLTNKIPSLTNYQVIQCLINLSIPFLTSFLCKYSKVISSSLKNITYG